MVGGGLAQLMPQTVRNVGILQHADFDCVGSKYQDANWIFWRGQLMHTIQERWLKRYFRMWALRCAKRQINDRSREIMLVLLRKGMLIEVAAYIAELSMAMY